MSRILVVDDKELMRDSVSATLARAGHSVICAADGKAALAMIPEKRPDLVLTDLKMPEMGGLELLEAIRRHDEELPVVLMTAFATVQTAVEAMKHGAYDYITKPFESDQLVHTVSRAIEHRNLIRENALLQSKIKRNTAEPSGPRLIGDSPVMQALKEQIKRIAQSQGTVLIMGESGVGKEVVAQQIHRMSPRAAAPMLAVNCAALSASLLESELFGHERGAFTGADRLRKGRFELAHEGTLLLDEISEIPGPIQAKLLRVLQERAFERVGSSATQKTDVRVIATTNRDLRASVASGQFRQDLYFRLHVLPIYVPPLRDRLEDVPGLCDHFLNAVATREGRPARRFSSDALAVMMQYAWPGNVRELFNVCERVSILAMDEVIDAPFIESWLFAAPNSPGVGSNTTMTSDDAIMLTAPGAPRRDNGESGREDPFEPRKATAPHRSLIDPAGAVVVRSSSRRLEDIEREVILETLGRHRGHRQRTAKELGIGVRTLGLKLRKWKDLKLVAEDV